MTDISIANPEARGLDGVAFTGTRGGAAHSFLVPREALEDVEYTMLETADAMLDAFGRLQDRVAQEAARALDAGRTGTPIVIDTLVS